MVALPLGKLLYLGIKQVSRPVSNWLRLTAKRSPFVRKYICIPPAQAFHRLEVFVKLRLMGSSVHTEVQPLKEERAVEIGADMLGEFFLYSIAASYILYEYFRSMRKDKLKQDSQDSNIVSLQKGMATLGTQLEQLRCRLEAMEKTKKTPSTTKS